MQEELGATILKSLSFNLIRMVIYVCALIMIEEQRVITNSSL